MKRYVYYIHVNKPKKCWTLHSSKGCFHYEHIEIYVPCETVHNPNKKDNPRFFIRCKGSLVDEGDYAKII
jgi:hypothetical protein